MLEVALAVDDEVPVRDVRDRGHRVPPQAGQVLDLGREPPDEGGDDDSDSPISAKNATSTRNTDRRSMLSRALFRRATAAAALTDENNGELWQGSITVGTPAQTYTVDFDTGSSDLFLPGPSCTSRYCKGHKKYTPASSSTSAKTTKTFTLRYGDGSSVTGTQYTDTVAIAGLAATGQALGAANTYSAGFAQPHFPPDGLLGMGYQTISVYNKPPVFASLVSQSKVTDPVFAFKLAKTGSELYLGGVNSDLYTGSFTFSAVSPQVCSHLLWS